MGCSSCSNNTNGTPKGCKSNGTCASGGCDKLGVFNWLSNMQLPGQKSEFNLVEIRFKNGRKHFYRNTEHISLSTGDAVVVESHTGGHDVGVVSLIGELTRLQVERKDGKNYKIHDYRKIYRKANQRDLDVWKEARAREKQTMFEARTLALHHDLQMKISDVEFQGDNKKAIFYYTAEGRVGFRQLIRAMADKFKIRIEMKQIGARQEAGRLGGIGSCGRELCCATWLTDFRSVSTSAARYQQLSLNPQKLAGQCGKLKCCLNYELDQYIEGFKMFPSNKTELETEKGVGVHQKTDIFKKIMWFSYKGDFGGTHYPLKIERINEIIELNKKGKKPADLNDFAEIIEAPKEENYLNVVGQDSLNRFDDKFKKKKTNKKKKKFKISAGPGTPSKAENNKNQTGKKPAGNKKRRFKGKKKKDD
jgi:cell fate regulator YaaT (PSP1 superfamily)